jgi:hypothetical protein
VLLATEGAAFLRNWLTQIRPGRTRREVETLQQRADDLERSTELLQTAIWMSVSSHGQPYEVAKKVRTMVMLDGWRRDDQLRAQAGDYSLDLPLTPGGLEPPGYTGPGT